MTTPALYNDVHQLTLDIVNAEANTRSQWAYYEILRKLCEKHEGSSCDHPFQWETLADFTTDDEVSLGLYEKALRKAEKLELNEYSASIRLAMAERYFELGINAKALSSVSEADAVARTTGNLDLRREISEFMLRLSENT